ncbi:imelysin family protein [Croceiramulus getboli]|nr:imelysin family protein [Flavobacteriaceae bacterium YJPT1-3]
MIKKCIGLMVLIFVMACSSGDDTPEPDGGPNPGPGEELSFDRSAMLTNWADNIIIPAYADYSQQLEVLASAKASFEANPNEGSLDEFRAAWVEAYRSWQRVSIFEIGPAETVNLRLNTNIYPTDVTLIESNIESGSYDFDLSSNRVAKGFPALDYLLYGKPDPQLVADLSTSAYSNYLDAIITDLQERTAEVYAAWTSSYRDTFVNNDGSSATASTDRMVNDFIFYFEKHLRAGKMGIPLGVFSGNALPENLEARFNGEISKELFLIGLQASQDFFNGVAYNGTTSGESLNTYLDELNVVKDGADLNAMINDQFDLARSAVSALGQFQTELENNPPTQMLNAYDEVQRLVPLFKVDMVSAMSIRIDFTDADGD